MTMSDPIADMLTRIRNAVLREHRTVSIPFSTIKENISRVLKEEGFVEGYVVEEAKVGKNLTISLKYDPKGGSVIRKIDRVSKPGLRVHRKVEEMKPLMNGQGIFIVSTSQGVLSDNGCRRSRVGGEVLCAVY
ncbi:MAG: 30S ribosomal protein S8 [Candidatus Lambdaproteobacteria bacterium RIFOXYD1_FULL_56_27]|uniref:Small ribosomal subunit protein uS8 n=1 Tax=Candidatus Lambdaproteobacteria bacterium RIFOXYD2_FULL_56_26 TaxID=1817773 RepID=A0A1F6GMM4_9PROT|nr:MAG: 30S ribosomal protein S8 [Candidatus Lambdaproteobacteria bacterium RIFOXYD2_FULL_56_26]OGH05631.1 MAG: 30S ribosomal protein S8 [Candidatus Lambdaproteobacteria bacterium RIFOXYC1_FULL_56_13]OGH08591.1 MAG: 30S ribosomal protein S8 [Candidatus Lambdaproteobacteria bacterium RIFOXYD1_FULL_56_27]